jgi:predicted metal-dependent phosphoesterase TrpH
MRIDLHAHSTASDGTMTPAEVMAAAAAAGLDVVALTDHDTTAGWAPAVAALPPGLTLVRGAELSCVADVSGGRRISIHLLAYLFDPTERTFAAQRAELRDHRLTRGRRIVERLAADGVPIQWSQVEQLAAGGAVGRPHVARVLVDLGLANSVDHAFRRYLYHGSPYHVPKQDLDAITAVRAVRAAGGVPVFAHPRARSRGRIVGDDTIVALAEAGLAGLEVDHIDHLPADREELRRLAAELDLITTGSSDFHGANKTIPLGACLTAEKSYEALVKVATSNVTPIVGR